MTKEERTKILEDHAVMHAGKVIPHELVTAAVDPNHALHSYFEWDDKVAGNAHRVEQARRFISEARRTVPVTIVNPVTNVEEEAEVAVPAFIVPMDSRNTGGGYVPFDASEFRKEAAIALRGFANRFDPVFSADERKTCARLLKLLNKGG